MHHPSQVSGPILSKGHELMNGCPRNPSIVTPSLGPAWSKPVARVVDLVLQTSLNELLRLKRETRRSFRWV